MLDHLWVPCFCFWAYHTVQALRTMPDEPCDRHLALMWAWWAVMSAFIYLF